MLKLGGAALLLAAGIGGLHWWTTARLIVSTNDAYASADSIAISPRVSGYVATVAVAENQHVRRGDTLVVVDNADYKLRVQQSEAAMHGRQAAIATIERQRVLQQSMIAQAQAALLAARSQASKVAEDYKRDRALIEKGYATLEQVDADRATTQAASAEVDKAAAAYEAAHAEFEVLGAKRAQLEADAAEAQAALGVAQLDNGHTVISAPIDGVVGDRNVQVGEYVRPGKQLFMLVPASEVYIIANFKETQVARMRVGQPVQIELDAYPGLKGRGTVQSFAPATGSEFSLLPPQNATGNFTKIVQRVPVKIVLSAGSGLEDKIRPGLSAVVAVDTRQQPGVVAEADQLPAGPEPQLLAKQAP